MSALSNSNAIDNGGAYTLSRSLRFRSSASAYLNRTFGTPTAATTWTYSVWAKKAKTPASGTDILLMAGSTSTNNAIWFTWDSTNVIGISNSAGTLLCKSTAVYRDPSAWYHVVVSNNAGSLTIYVNNTSVATGSGTCNINQSGTVHYIGSGSGTNYFFDGYLTEINFIDGQALTPSSFGATNPVTGVWAPLKYSGTYGTNGFYLPFSNNSTASTLGYDFSGNNNNWAPNNISVTAGTTYDSMTDVPTLSSPVTANYCTANPLDASPSSTSAISNGNLTVNVSGSSAGGGNGGQARVNTINFTNLSGKWYWEAFIDNAGTGAATLRLAFFMAAEPINISGQGGPYTWFWRADGVNGTVVNASTFATNDVVMFAYDSDTGKLWLGKNGTWTNSGVPSTGTNPNATLTALTAYALGLNYNTSGGGTGTASFNFGQRPFSYTPPTGFLAVNTYNLPTPTILQGNKYMDATTYTGTGATQTITNACGFKPDLVWIKARSIAYFHRLSDSVRGIGKELYSNDTGAETTNQVDGWVSAFNSNGFSILGGAGVNLNANTFVGWQWQAGQGTTSSNTSGSITSTVSVNASAGFSVVTFTGTNANATVGHGLGVAPSMYMVKQRSATGDWFVYHQGIGATKGLFLNLTNAATTNTYFNNTAPTSTVFSVGGGVGGLNANGVTQVAYCWAEIAGFSKFGSYTGNYNVDGVFVYCGFRPKFILIKAANNAYDWELIDTSRSTYNGSSNYLQPNLSSAEYSTTSDIMDILSNGFKMRNNWTRLNDTITYIYAAFAENPFKNALAR